MSSHSTPTARELTASGLLSALNGVAGTIARPDPARAVRGQIATLVARYDNPSSVCERAAVDAACAGHGAYWTSHTYSQSSSRMLCELANHSGLAGAITYMTACGYLNPRETISSKRPSFAINALIPLNVKAEVELREAKERAYWDEA
jgi:hypothetical protein